MDESYITEYCIDDVASTVSVYKGTLGEKNNCNRLSPEQLTAEVYSILMDGVNAYFEKHAGDYSDMFELEFRTILDAIWHLEGEDL